MIQIRKSRDHRLRFVLVRETEPHGVRGYNTRFIDTLAVLVDREGKDGLFRRPESLVQYGQLLVEPLVDLRLTSCLPVSLARLDSARRHSNPNPLW